MTKVEQEQQQFLKGLEKKLWNSANKLRSNLDAAVYKHVVLGLVFLKYVSNSFDQRREKLKLDFTNPEHQDYLDGDESLLLEELEDRDAYTEDNVFWVPEPARWNNLQNSSKLSLGSPLPWGGEFKGVGKLVDDAMTAIEKDNPKLKNILNKDYGRLQLDASKLGQLIDLIATIPFNHKAMSSKDILGHVYEYFLGEFASAEGKKGGQFYTPKSIVNLIVEMLQPFKGRVYDPCCGSGGFFISSDKFIEEHGGKTGDASIYGQESNPTTWRLAAMNMVIRGIEFDLGKEPADTLNNGQHPDLRASFVMANPPFNQKEWGGANDDKRWKYGIPPKSNANFAWLQHILYHLNSNGLAGVVLANMSLASNDNQEEKIRKQLIDNDLIDCIINLPDKLFTSTPIGASIWIFNKNKENNKYRSRKKEVLFIDASDCFEVINRTLNDLTKENIALISQTYLKWSSIGSVYKNIDGFCKSVYVQDIVNNKYSLFPSAYIDIKKSSNDFFLDDKNNDIVEISRLIDELKEIEPNCLAFLDKLFNELHPINIESEIYKIGDVLEQSKECLGDRDEPEILTCTENAGLIFQKDRFSKRVATDNTSKYKLVKKTDIVYNPYLLWAGAMDQCWIVDEGITSPAYAVFKIKEGFDPAIIGVALKSDFMRQKYDGISVGTVKRRRRAPPEKFLELEVSLPSKDEQKKTIESSLNLKKVIFIHNEISRLYKNNSYKKYDAILQSIQ